MKITLKMFQILEFHQLFGLLKEVTFLTYTVSFKTIPARTFSKWQFWILASIYIFYMCFILEGGYHHLYPCPCSDFDGLPYPRDGGMIILFFFKMNAKDEVNPLPSEFRHFSTSHETWKGVLVTTIPLVRRGLMIF